jgi:hypothetical protein
MMMNWKGFGRQRSWPNFRYYPDIRLKGLRKIISRLKLCPEVQARCNTVRVARVALFLRYITPPQKQSTSSAAPNEGARS